jgi:hypothetical protein
MSQGYSHLPNEQRCEQDWRDVCKVPGTK